MEIWMNRLRHRVVEASCERSDSQCNLGNVGEPRGRGARSVALLHRIGINQVWAETFSLRFCLSPKSHYIMFKGL